MGVRKISLGFGEDQTAMMSQPGRPGGRGGGGAIGVGKLRDSDEEQAGEA